MEGLNFLSNASIDTMPWVMVDVKRDDLVAKVPVTGIISLTDEIPERPGLYHMPVSLDQMSDYSVDKWLNRALSRGNVGIYMDEGGRLPARGTGLRNVLTLGRSARVPLVFLSQRPVWIDTFNLSEAEFIQVFWFQHPDDQAKILEFIPPDLLDFDELRRKGKYWSAYYHATEGTLHYFEPGPTFDQIADKIQNRIPIYEYEGSGHIVGSTIVPRRKL